jgi:hypothetical protein
VSRGQRNGSPLPLGAQLSTGTNLLSFALRSKPIIFPEALYLSIIHRGPQYELLLTSDKGAKKYTQLYIQASWYVDENNVQRAICQLLLCRKNPTAAL